MDTLGERAREELGHADFEHQARTTRAVRMWERLAAEPKGTVTAAFPIPAERKGAYRWLESGAVGWQPLADAVHAATARRCRDHALVIVPVDGSSLAHTDTLGDDGVGSIGSRAAGARGVKTMTLVPLSYDGVPLGVGAHALWARPDAPHPTPHAQRALHDKESRWWTDLQEQFEATLRAEGAATLPWYQLDREADASHVLLRGVRPGSLVTVRAHQDRLLTAQACRRKHLKLHAAVTSAPALGVMWLVVPRAKGRPERLARLEVRVVHVGLKLRALWSHGRLGEVAVTAVSVREVGTCPAGAEPLEWLLLTTFPVASFDDAVRVVRAYGLRWVVERVHFTWKSGTCQVEASQLESFEALRKWATLHLSVAVHRQHMLHLSRTQPELPCDQVFEREQIDAALTLYSEHRREAPRPGATPTLGELVEIIARLGGYTGKSSGGPPGIKVFARGMERVETAAIVLRLQRQLARSPTSGEGFG